MTVPPILVTGGTGTLGRQVVEQLRQAGRDVRVLSRRSPDATHNTEASNTTGDSNTTEATNTTGAVHYVTGDLATGAGLAAAVRGAGTIVHCAPPSSTS